MIVNADNGLIASKPYAASGAYINKMSDYCKGCEYNVKQKSGQTACPFNYLYWDFMLRNQQQLKSNRRLAFTMKQLEKFSPERTAEIQSDAQAFFDSSC